MCTLRFVPLYSLMTMCAHGAKLKEVPIHSDVTDFSEGFLHEKLA